MLVLWYVIVFLIIVSHIRIVKWFIKAQLRSSWRDPDVKIPVRHRCQFSWYCDGKSDDIIANELDIYTVASDIAHRIYSGAIDDVTNGATHYHADYVIPAWAATKIRTIKIDDHIFYRWEF